MLIEFSVANYLSFKDLVTFSMVAERISEHKETHVFDAGKKINLLTSCAVYGANASGKSNLFKALNFMQRFVRTSSKDTQIGESIDVTPFVLSTVTEKEPSSFEVVFIRNEIIYRYGFEVDHKRVHREWLYYLPKTREIKLFERNNDKFDLSKHFAEGDEWTDKTRDNALFLSVVAQWKGKISTQVVDWFSHGLKVVTGLGEYREDSVEIIQDDAIKDKFMDFIKAADLGIAQINVEKRKLIAPWRSVVDGFDASQLNRTQVYMFHPKYDANNDFHSFEKFSLDAQESEGTRKIFSMLGPVLDALRSGKTVVVDELDSNLHPVLTQAIIGCFNSNETNPRHAQLVFNTHDTNLLSNRRLRRDQIWFCEKDRYGASHLYSLVDYAPEKGKIRKDEAYEKNYLMGKYGAIPYIGQFEFDLDVEVGDNSGE